MTKPWAQIKKELGEPFESKDVEWRLQRLSKNKASGLAVAYVDARAIQNRLDNVVGPENWQDEYHPWHSPNNSVKDASQLCRIRIFDAERNSWISKTDGAENTDIEPVKGGLSDAFKRAAVKWGGGRYLYDLPATWVDVDPDYPKAIPDKELPKLHRVHDNYVAALRRKKDNSAEPVKRNERPSSPPAQNTVPQAEMKKPEAKPPIKVASRPALKYIVRQMEKRKYNHITHQILDLEQENGDIITVFLSEVNQDVKPGIVLQSVKIGAHEGRGDSKRIFYTLDDYQISA